MDETKLLGLKDDGTPYKVLIIDDSVFIVKQLRQLLSSQGFEIIDTSNDGEEGINKYKEHFPNVDLVTLDITMPKMDGITALEKIIEFDSKATVVIISALGKEDLVKKALISGAKNFIVKPLEREKVFSRLKTVLIK